MNASSGTHSNPGTTVPSWKTRTNNSSPSVLHTCHDARHQRPKEATKRQGEPTDLHNDLGAKGRPPERRELAKPERRRDADHRPVMSDEEAQLKPLPAVPEQPEVLRELLQEHADCQLVVRRRVLRSVPDIAGVVVRGRRQKERREEGRRGQKRAEEKRRSRVSVSRCIRHRARGRDKGGVSDGTHLYSKSPMANTLAASAAETQPPVALHGSGCP